MTSSMPDTTTHPSSIPNTTSPPSSIPNTTTHPSSVPTCRHCGPGHADEFAASSASVLLTGCEGGLQAAVEELEAQGVMPGLTAVCPACNRVSALAPERTGGGYSHLLAMWRRVRPFLDGRRQRPDR